MIFFKEPDVLFRCTYCKAEESFSKKFVIKLETETQEASNAFFSVISAIPDSLYLLTTNQRAGKSTNSMSLPVKFLILNMILLNLCLNTFLMMNFSD